VGQEKNTKIVMERINFFLAIPWNPDPELLSLGPISIRWYGLMFLVAFLGGLYFTNKILISEKYNSAITNKLFFYVIIGTIIGARLGHVFFYDWGYFKDNLLEIILPFKFKPNFRFVGYSGLASHGAAIGITVALWIFCKKIIYKPLLWLIDRVVIAIAWGGSFVRIGNLMNSEIFGTTADLPWGFQFLRATYLENPNIPRHPTQIYEALWYFLNFLGLYFLFWKTNAKNKQGFLTGMFFVWVFGFRFLVEFIKENQVDFESTMVLNMGQWLSIPFVLLGLFLVFRKIKFRYKV